MGIALAVDELVGLVGVVLHSEEDILNIAQSL